MNKKGYTIIEIIVVLFLLAAIIFMFITTRLAIKEVHEVGLKNIIEEVWTGTDKKNLTNKIQ